jgi:glycosyltransferase involved in cell wall biosynthesis
VNIERPAVAAVAVDESSGDYFTAAVFALRLRGGRKAVCLADEGAKFLRLSWRYVLRIMLRRGGDWLRRRGRGFIRLFKRAGLASAEDLILHRLTSPPRPAETGNPRVLIVTEGDGVSQRYRCEHKAEQLRLLGWPVRFRRASQYESSFSQLISDAGWADMVIFHRVPPRGTIERLIEHFHRTRRPAVFDIDDWVFEAEALDYIAWSRPEPLDGVISANAFLLERCSHAIGASMPLVERLRARGKPAWLLINNVSLEWLNLAERARRFRQPQEGTLLAYSSGTPSHDRDFEQIVPALLRVMQAMPSVRLRIAGLLEVPEEMSRFADRVEQIGFVPWRKIPYILGDVDLNLAPLEMGNPFAESKSELKYLEAGTLGLPTIASPTPAYRTAIAHGKTGLLAMGAEEWAEALLGCVESPGRRQELGENARRHVMEVYHPRAAAGRLAAVLSEILS